MTFDLKRFVDAQRATFDGAIAELRAGHKRGHWMWFVFPQLRGLGRSETSRFFGLEGPAEARAYLAHPLLGPRLHEACRALLEGAGTAPAAPDAPSAVDVLGPVDAMKLRSSATLFHRVAPDDDVFSAVLERFYGGAPDPATDGLLAEAQPTGDAER
jgi:uncharacterized protein (DUF1810 family)